jgi:hypothetical protein
MPTFLERAKEVIVTQTEGVRGSRPANAWERSLLHYAKDLHDKKVDTVTTAEVMAVLKPIWLTKAPTRPAKTPLQPPAGCISTVSQASHERQ